MDLLEKHWIKIPVILYVIGFIVHNVYLSDFGSYEFQLVQAKYILSGFGLIGFSVICFVYTGIRINLSDVSKSFTKDNLLPWILRVVSLPYFVYSILYGKEIFNISEHSNDTFVIFSYIAYSIAYAVVMFSLLNIIMMIGQVESFTSKAINLTSKILSIPMFVSTLIIAWNIPEFSGIMKATTYFFLVYVGIAMRQSDKNLGIEPKYSAPETNERHENIYQFVFGIIGIFILLSVVTSNYTKYVYPKIPVALGGAKLELVSIKTKDNTYDSYLIQETKDWVMYINKNNGQVEKIKTDLIEKIVFKEEIPHKKL